MTMETKTGDTQRINVTVHRFDGWADHEGGTARTMCGREVEIGASQRAIDRSEVASEVSCPLCELAELCRDVELPEYEQPSLFD
ncbi:hypothetical protein [Bifidobacterium scaligerum]|uniref:Uncharacterized protein n=1 Tax=Bifidobacterium scaligerum TaxID=2052656 RepID=A0A2M9HQF2_9BIFI|nr:hypothetical protein [Bifidobacterium scaligerum]PJM79018.1 hypothetical protein CUU80_06680 [Bifidobacterium scaligerum]